MGGVGLGLGCRRRMAESSATVLFNQIETEQDVFDWIIQTGGGASGAKPRWPGVPYTVGNGLGLLLDLPSLGQEGVQFSRKSGLAAPADGSAHPQWIEASKRISIINADPVADRVVRNYQIAGYVENALSAGEVLIEDTVIDSAGLSLLFSVRQTFDTSVLTMRRCRISGASSTLIQLRQGTIADCHMTDTSYDCIVLQSHTPKLILRNFARKIGQVSGSHGDVIQTSNNVSNVLTFGNLFYAPYFVNPLNEGAYGTNAILNYNNGATVGTDVLTVSDVMSVNDALIGARQSIQISPDPNCLVNGVAVIGSWFSKPGGAYGGLNDFYPQAAATTGQSRNTLVHNCRRIEDASPVTKNGVDAAGLWDYDKAMAPARFKQVGRMLGYLDWNDDPVVAVRTGFHPGTS